MNNVRTFDELVDCLIEDNDQRYDEEDFEIEDDPVSPPSVTIASANSPDSLRPNRTQALETEFSAQTLSTTSSPSIGYLDLVQRGRDDRIAAVGVSPSGSRHHPAEGSHIPVARTVANGGGQRDSLRFSRVQRASPHEIPRHKEIVPDILSTQAPTSGPGSHTSSRQALVASIVQLLNQATETHNNNEVRKAVVASGTQTQALPVLRTGLTKAQALSVSGKLLHRDLPDWDPDYNEGVELIGGLEGLFGGHEDVHPQSSREISRQPLSHPSTQPSHEPKEPPTSMPPASMLPTTRPTPIPSTRLGPNSQAESQCEAVYSGFIGDLITLCKTRAERCQSPEEMAMLRVLSEHVRVCFSAETMGAVHARMIAASCGAEY